MARQGTSTPHGHRPAALLRSPQPSFGRREKERIVVATDTIPARFGLERCGPGASVTRSATHRSQNAAARLARVVPDARRRPMSGQANGPRCRHSKIVAAIDHDFIAHEHEHLAADVYDALAALDDMSPGSVAPLRLQDLALLVEAAEWAAASGAAITQRQAVVAAARRVRHVLQRRPADSIDRARREADSLA